MANSYMQAIETLEEEGNRVRKKFLDKTDLGAKLSIKEVEERDDALASIQQAIDTVHNVYKEREAMMKKV